MGLYRDCTCFFYIHIIFQPRHKYQTKIARCDKITMPTDSSYKCVLSDSLPTGRHPEIFIIWKSSTSSDVAHYYLLPNCKVETPSNLQHPVVLLHGLPKIYFPTNLRWIMAFVWFLESCLFIVAIKPLSWERTTKLAQQLYYKISCNDSQTDQRMINSKIKNLIFIWKSCSQSKTYWQSKSKQEKKNLRCVWRRVALLFGKI